MQCAIFCCGMQEWQAHHEKVLRDLLSTHGAGRDEVLLKLGEYCDQHPGAYPHIYRWMYGDKFWAQVLSTFCLTYLETLQPCSY